jgi:hypothetical protein
MTKGRVAMVVLCLLVGSAATVLVAWTLALVDLPKPAGPPDVIDLPKAWPDAAPADWSPAESRSLSPRWWGDLEFATGGTRDFPGGQSGTTIAMQVERVGLPLRAVMSTQILDGRTLGKPGCYSEVLTLPTWRTGLRPSWRKNRRIGDHFYSCILGVRPVWPGFALDTLLYGALAWGLWRAPLAIRRGLRRRAGRCVKCGYDLRATPIGSRCPECGWAPLS